MKKIAIAMMVLETKLWGKDNYMLVPENGLF